MCFRDDDREKLCVLKSSSSEESVRRRASSSNDSMLSENSASASNSNSPFLQSAPVTWTKVSDLLEASSNEKTTVLLNQTREVLETTVWLYIFVNRWRLCFVFWVVRFYFGEGATKDKKRKKILTKIDDYLLLYFV